MGKVVYEKGFVSAQATLPPNVYTLSNAPDGCYLCISPGKYRADNHQKYLTFKGGELIFRSENGHYYRWNTQLKKFSGCGKRSGYGNFGDMLVQQVDLDFIVKPCKKRAVTKKKVTKKKVTKKKRK
jgi:hypothetical protein